MKWNRFPFAQNLTNKNRTNKIPVRISRGEFLSEIRLSRVAISLFQTSTCFCLQSLLHYAHVILENGHARTVGGSPFASLCAFAVPQNRQRISCSGALWRLRIDRVHRVRNAFGSPVLTPGGLTPSRV